MFSITDIQLASITNLCAEETTTREEAKARVAFTVAALLRGEEVVFGVSPLRNKTCELVGRTIYRAVYPPTVQSSEPVDLIEIQTDIIGYGPFQTIDNRVGPAIF